MIIEQDGFVYEIFKNETAAVKNYKGNETSLVIPWEIDEYPVISIGDWAFGKFFGSNPLATVSIPEHVSYIGAYAFNNCTQLTHVFLPEELSSIGISAFSGCSSLENITVPTGVTTIEDRVFNGCRSLTSANLHDDITKIGKGAFAGCRSLTDLNLPSGITRIEYESFRDCRLLSNIIIHENIEYIGNYSFFGCTSLTCLRLSDQVTYIGHKEPFPPMTLIRGSYGSYAEQYAKKYFFPFEPIFPDEPDITKPPNSYEIMYDVLQKILKTQGNEAFKNPQRFRGLISDFLPGSGKNAGFRNILCVAIGELNIFETLEQAKLSGDYIATSRLVHALVELGYQESLAKEVVNCIENII